MVSACNPLIHTPIRCCCRCDSALAERRRVGNSCDGAVRSPHTHAGPNSWRAFRASDHGECGRRLNSFLTRRARAASACVSEKRVNSIILFVNTNRHSSKYARTHTHVSGTRCMRVRRSGVAQIPATIPRDRRRRRRSLRLGRSPPIRLVVDYGRRRRRREHTVKKWVGHTQPHTHSNGRIVCVPHCVCV